MEKYVLAPAGIVAVGVLLGFWVVGGPIWHGRRTLIVELDDRTGGSVAAVSAGQAGAEDADLFLRGPTSADWILEDVGWVAGQPFTLEVRTFGNRSNFGGGTYGQLETLLLRVDYADGTHRNLTARIPDLRVEHWLKVVVPAGTPPSTTPPSASMRRSGS